jgi:hypothetical protein
METITTNRTDFASLTSFLFVKEMTTEVACKRPNDPKNRKNRSFPAGTQSLALMMSAKTSALRIKAKKCRL